MLISFPIVILSVILCNYYLDAKIALFVHDIIHRNKIFASYTSDIPDVLMYFVFAVTAISAYLYICRSKKGISDQKTLLFKVRALVAPFSYILKSASKVLFGRIQTRAWLNRHSLYGFNWFHGEKPFDGFPSGHMVVCVALLASLWRLYPKYKIGYLLTAIILACALIATNYHFLGDVLAGIYLGIVAERIIFHVVKT